MSRVPIRLACAGALAMCCGALPGAQPDPYAYRLYVTPQDGPVDPAVDRRFTPRYRACSKRAVATPEIDACGGEEFKRQDAMLNRTWRATLARLPAREHPGLLAAQRKWLAARDPFCDHVSDAFRGGTIVPIAYTGCRTELTIRRSMWLEKLS